MNKIRKAPARFLSVLLCLMMVLMLVPITAFAAEITTGNATVTAPVAGETPSFTATSDDPSSYSVEVLRWTDVENSQDITQINLNDPSSPYYNYKFITGKQYNVLVEFTPVGENTLSYDNSFTINGETTWWSSDGFKRGYTFTATGETATYTVSFNANGGSGTMADVTGISGSYALPSCTFTAPDDKQFKGWATSVDGTAISTASIDVAADTTLYAIWENIPVGEYSITVTDGKATIGAGTEVSKASEGTAVTLTANAAPSGKMFDKWEVVSGGITLADATNAITTFTMPANAVSVKATYKTASATYAATVADINISLPAGYGSSAINELGEQRTIKITNTGTETLNIGVPTLSGTNADAFDIQSFGSSVVTAGSTNSTAYAVQPKTGLYPGTYTATISCKDIDSHLSAPVTATVTLTVGEHHFDTSTWENNATHHWNPCTDTGCTAHGNEALHDSNVIKNNTEATFDTDGYTGDKHCSVCDRKTETGTAIAAEKYIRESKATMTPASITADQCANNLVFASLDTSKYTVALHSVYDLTDTSLNTASDGKYPNDTKFVSGHQYRIIFSFSEVSPYVYDETHDTHWSTFTLNGAATDIAPFSSLAGSKNRMIELTAGASGITTYTVSFNANGGTGTMTNVTGVSGEYTLPACTFTAPANKQFKGWAKSATGTVISGTTIDVTANTTLYAIWEDIPVTEYTITVTDGKATIGAGTEISKAAEGTTITLIANAAPSGKVFDKWVVESGGITLADASSATTTFTMPAGAVSVKATYKDAPHTHNLTLVPANPPTCTDAGNTAYYTCDGCDKWFEDATGASEITDKTSVVLTATGHTPSDWKSDADNHWKECTVVGCGVIIDGSKVAHTASDWITDTAATADTDGTKHKECTVCGYIMETGTIPTTGSGEHTHNYSSDWKSDADKHWHECSCGDKADVATHTASDWITDTAATATTDGTKHKECTVCHRVLETGTIPATGSGEHTHSYGSEWKSDADKHWHECSCGDKTDVAAHTASDWITDTAATATTDGTKHKECTVCRRVMETGTIPATGSGEHTHNYSSDWKSDSINHWKECSCGDKDDVAAHSFKWVVDKEATATKKGSKHEECKVCGYQRPAVEIPATGSTTKPTDPTESNPNTGALDDVPQTGDNSNMFLWIVLLLASGLGVTGTVVYSRRKKCAK